MRRVSLESALGVGELASSWGPWSSWGLVCVCVCTATWLTGSVQPSVSRARALYSKVGSSRQTRWRGWGVAREAAVEGAPDTGRTAALSRGRAHRVASALTLLGAGPRQVPPLASAAAGVLGGLGLLTAVWQRSLLPLGAGSVFAWGAWRWLRRQERQREATRREAAVVQLCLGIAAELRAGRQPEEALLAVEAEEMGLVDVGVLAAARFGGDVPGAFRRASLRPGCAGLGGVAACWQVAAEEGAGLAAGLDRVASALRVERDQREDVRAQMAGPRATVAILAVLPLLGLVLGTVMGADPLGVLLHSPIGWALIAGALVLEAAGLAWVGWIVRRAEGGATGAHR